METTQVRSTLLQSSPTTRAWLKVLRDGLPDLEYTEAKYYAALRSKITNRAVAELNPQKKGIRLFLRLKPGEDPALQATPATQNWADHLPSFFKINSEQDLMKARALIEKSDAEDRCRG